MSLKFTVVRRKNLRDLTAPEKYYATLKSSGTANIKEMVQSIGEFTSLSEPDIISVISALRIEMQRAISQGKSVRWDNFGSFVLSISGEGCENEEDVKSDSIRKTKISFRAGPDLKDALNKIKYKKIK